MSQLRSLSIREQLEAYFLISLPSYPTYYCSENKIEQYLLHICLKNRFLPLFG